MTPEQYALAKRAFLALSGETPTRRAESLAQLSGNDPVVIAEVESLLAAHDQLPTEPRPRGAKKAAAVGYAPGTSILDRYRIVAKLGHGGMGEIYRADDVVLGEPVALKFLREGSAASKEMLLNELKLARQIAHPNVCRLYDVGEIDGRFFLSMEYIDGEDLASLLQRIGRLPSDRTLVLARQLFSGLAAAHAKGVVHCDVKPANIMVDGRGNARLTDFGIAHLEDVSDESGLLGPGTPAYMAPERLLGQRASVRGDLYSLGLVLYEMCTGVHPFGHLSRHRLIEAQLKSDPPPPSTLVDIDPALERLIQQCLEKEPQDRPASALTVAAALSNSDPLELALAIGETPPPELVAQSRAADVLTPWQATFWGGAILVILALVLITADAARQWDEAELHFPPEVMAQKARELLENLGWKNSPSSSGQEAFGYLQNPSAPAAPQGSSAPGTSSLLFWFRQSQRPIVPMEIGQLLDSVRVGPYDPPNGRFAGDTLILLHPTGWLDHFELRPYRSADETLPRATDFRPLLTAAGLTLDDFTADEQAAFLPPFFVDQLATLKGESRQLPTLPLTLRVASFQGKPVYFRMTAEALSPPAENPPPHSFFADFRVFEDFNAWYDLLYILAALTAIPLARFNLRRGRGDRRGAWRLASFVFLTKVAIFFFDGFFVLDLRTQWALVNLQVGQALLDAGLAWVFYLALEPYVRRIWPHTLITWTRLLAGRFEDRLLARHVLIGLGFGVFWALCLQLDALAPGWLGQETAVTNANANATAINNALSTGVVLATFATHLQSAIYNSVFSLLLLVVMRFLWRRAWAATLTYVLAATLLYSHGGATFFPSLLLVGLIPAVGEAFLLVRFGLVSLAAATFTTTVLNAFPLTLDRQFWFATSGHAAVVLILAMAALALRRAAHDPPRRTLRTTSELTP